MIGIGVLEDRGVKSLVVGGGLKSNIDQMGKGQIMDRYGTKQDGTGRGILSRVKMHS